MSNNSTTLIVILNLTVILTHSMNTLVEPFTLLTTIDAQKGEYIARGDYRSRGT